MDDRPIGGVEKLYAARRHITAVAARWQAAGVDTSPLTPALLAIQEVIAEMESRLASEAFQALTQDLRKHFNAVRVSGAGLETEDNPANRLRWIDLMEQAADRCIEILDRIEQTPPE